MPPSATTALNRRALEAQVQRRMAAQAIDGALALVAGFLLSLIHPLWSVLALAAVLAKDSVPHASPGKSWLGLHVAEAGTNRRCSLSASFLRNLFLLPPLGMIEVLVLTFSRDGLRLGDRAARTWVTSSAMPHPEAVARRVSSSPQPSPAPRPADAAPRLVLGVDDDADQEAIEDAFWAFVERYSDDATRHFADGQLAERCAELADRFAALAAEAALPVPPTQPATREQMQGYLNEHVIAVNRARDQLLA